MFLTEQNGAQMWSKMLKENFDVKDNEKLNWVSQYAAGSQVPGSGVNPLYATPLNTIGMGNPYAPQNVNTMSTAPHADGNLWNQQVGSGDIPVSTLPMALNIALMTIGLELVPVVPAKGPWVMLSYMDFPYAGGKLGRVNETSFDGKGDREENKPIYVKIQGMKLEKIQALRDAIKEAKAKEGDVVKVNKVQIGTFLGFGRMDGAPLVKVWNDNDDFKANLGDKSLREVFEDSEVPGAPTVQVGTAVESTLDKAIRPDFVQTSVDLVDGFANFATGKKEAMTRAQNETGTGNVIGLRLFSKWVQVGYY